MGKVKTTLSVDEALMRRVRVRAARLGRRDGDVLEEALKEGLGIIERIRAKARLSEDEAIGLAHDILGENKASPRSSRKRS